MDSILIEAAIKTISNLNKTLYFKRANFTTLVRLNEPF